MFLAIVLLFWTANAAIAIYAPDRMRHTLRLVLPLAVIGGLAWFADTLVPWQKLLATTLGLLTVIKSTVLLHLYQRRQLKARSKLGLLAYLTIWPGVDPEPLKQRTAVEEEGTRFTRGLFFMLGGTAVALATACFWPAIGPTVGGWLGLASLLMIVHFGYADMLTTLIRLAGWNTNPLFNEPLKSTSLRDFWSNRWNLAFVEMDRILFLKGLRNLLGVRAAVFGVFLISGLLHDLCISYSSGGGWGLPTIYFILHGFAVLAEGLVLGKKAPKAVQIAWTWAWLLLPLPLLFTAQFRGAFIEPLFQSLHVLVTAHSAEWYLSAALWIGAIGHFCTFGAGFQVPFRLNWREELSRVSPFNRKIFLNYAAYVGLMIFAFGSGTILLHDEMMRGERAALFLCGVITCFWAVRLLVDYFWFGSDDWPKGALFVIGHACLNTLFLFLTGTYLAVILWHITGIF